MDKSIAVILAGGSGTRFWPKSRKLSPKQLCKIGNIDETMIEITLGRLEGYIPPDRRVIVTHVMQAEKTKEIVGNRAHVLAEPQARNTSNALILAAKWIEKNFSPDHIMVSLHADHIIKKREAFLQSIKTAVKQAQAGKLVLLGIKPEYPETGYGYIEKGDQLEQQTFLVKNFREKPNAVMAKQFFESGQFLWNAGLFVWQVQTFLQEFKNYQAEHFSMWEHIGSNMLDNVKSLEVFYKNFPNISIDHAILEKSKKLAVVSCDIAWQDVGSWDALSHSFPVDLQKNYKHGDIVAIDSQNNIIETDGPLIACLGIKDMIVVHAKGAVLVCPRERAQDVKIIVEELEKDGRLNLI